MNAYETHIGKQISIRENAETDFFNLIGKHQNSVRNFYDANMIFDTALAQSPAYNCLLDELDIKKFVFGIQALFWMKKIDPDNKNYFLEDIEQPIQITGVPTKILQKGLPENP